MDATPDIIPETTLNLFATHADIPITNVTMVRAMARELLQLRKEMRKRPALTSDDLHLFKWIRTAIRERDWVYSKLADAAVQALNKLIGDE